MRDAIWETYAATILEFPELELRIDLRKALSEDMVTLVHGALGGDFAIVTADNPDGAVLSDAENAKRLATLCAELDTAGLKYVRADGLSPDADHRETGVAVLIDRERAMEIARRYEQLGLFWFDGRVFWLVPVIKESEPIRLPRT